MTLCTCLTLISIHFEFNAVLDRSHSLTCGRRTTDEELVFTMVTSFTVAVLGAIGDASEGVPLALASGVDEVVCVAGLTNVG